jgi:hypothetical protein
VAGPGGPEVLASDPAPERGRSSSWRAGSAPRRTWLGPAAVATALAVVAGSYGWGVWSRAAEEQSRTGAVEVSVEAPLPFSADSGAAEGILRLRNSGPLALSVLTLDLRPAGVRIVSENLPLWVGADRDRLVVVRIELDCSAPRRHTTARSVLLRARTVDGRERVETVRLDVLPTILAGLRREVCDPPLLPVADDVTFGYAGIIDVADGRITTRLLARNERSVPVTITRIRAVSGWPALDAAASSRLPVTVPAGGSLPLDIVWDVSRCVRSESGRFSSGLHLEIAAPERSEQLAVLEPGIDYTRDFFRRYAEICPDRG